MNTSKYAIKRGGISNHEKEMFAALFLEGYSPEEIGKQFNRSEGAVQRSLHRMGYKDRFRVPQTEIDDWINLYQNDRMSVISIARLYKRAPQTVTHHLLRNNVRIRHAGHRNKKRRK